MACAGLPPEELLAGFTCEEQKLDWRVRLPAHPENLLIEMLGGRPAG